MPVACSPVDRKEEIAADLPARSTGKRAKLDPAKIPGAVRAPMPRAVTPMTATLERRPPEGADWTYEVKWDGVRALCYIDNGAVEILSPQRQPPATASIPR